MNDLLSATKLKTVSILGCGWYGLELAKALISFGYEVKGSTTRAEKLSLLAKQHIQPFLINFQKEEERYDAAFFDSDLLIICIPPKRNSGEQAIFSAKIERICNVAKINKTKHLFFISSTAVYGDTNSEVTEETIPRPETASGKAILEAEKLLQNQTDFTSTIIRFAGLIGPDRNPGRFFAGKTGLPNGLAPINLIHLEDCIGITLKLITDKAFGDIYNVCAPHHPTKQEFYVAATENIKLVRPIFKPELLNWKIVSSSKELIINYKYNVANWIDWVNNNKS